MGKAGRLYCGVVLTYCGGVSEERVPALVVLSPGEGEWAWGRQGLCSICLEAWPWLPKGVTCDVGV